MRVLIFLIPAILSAQSYPQQQPYPPQQYPPQQQYPQGQYPPQQGQYPQNGYPPAPVLLAPQQIDGLVARIALYPDGLLAQVLTAATYSNELQDAAGWATQHQYLQGGPLAQAIADDRLPFDASVIALIPFPSVLSQMAQDPAWSQQLGNAVLAQRADVMDAVQRMRQQAYSYGYLQNNQYERVVAGPGSIEIDPVMPNAYYVPAYDPLIVYRRPRPGFFAGSAIRFGPAITLGVGFSSYGWSSPGFGWREHSILIDRRPWVRTWNNRQSYVPPYAAAARQRYEGPRVEHHEFQDRGGRDGRDRNGRDREGRDHGHDR